MSGRVTVSIHQPNYLPWAGYFRKIVLSDIFIFFDNVLMPMGKSFVSRNRILTQQGPRWLTVPIRRTSRPHMIAETGIADQHWPRKHVRTIEIAYAHAPWRGLIEERLAPIMTADHERIADLNVSLIKEIADILGLTDVRFARASEMGLSAAGATSIPEILARTGAQAYVTGRGAGTMRYLDECDLRSKRIETRFVSDEFLPYPQQVPGFEPNLSIIDVLLNCGPERTRAILEENGLQP